MVSNLFGSRGLLSHGGTPIVLFLCVSNAHGSAHLGSAVANAYTLGTLMRGRMMALFPLCSCRPPIIPGGPLSHYVAPVMHCNYAMQPQ